MRIRRMIVRVVNKIRGVDAWELHEMRCKALITIGSLALYMNVPYIVIADWENEYAAIPKTQYEKAMEYLRARREEREHMKPDSERRWA